MDFAADAVIDVIAPPPARAAAPAQASPSSDPSFDDHLDAASADEAPDATAEAQTEPKADAAPETGNQPSTQPVATPPPQNSAALMLQLINQPAPSPEPQAPTGADAAAPVEQATSGIAPQLPSPPATKEQAAADPVPALAGGEEQRTEAIDASTLAPQKNTEAAARAEASTQQPSQQQAAPQPQPQPTAPAAAAPVPSTETQNVPTSPAQTGLAAIQSAPAARAAPTHPPAAQAGKADAAKIEGKRDAADAKTLEHSAAQKTNGANSAPTQSKPNTDSFVPVSAPETAQAPQAHATPLGGTTTSVAAHAQTAVLEQSTARTATPAAAQVARKIVRQFNGENTRFELRLDPPELGRVEVRLEVSRDHRVTAVVSADSPQALSELARHARELEQTLQSAGLQLNDNGLSFDLRQSRDEADNDGAPGRHRGGDDELNEAPAHEHVAARPIGLERWRGVRVDVMV